MQIKVFWVVMLCSVAVQYQHFRGPYCLHLQGIATLCGISTQKTLTWIFTITETSNLASSSFIFGL